MTLEEYYNKSSNNNNNRKFKKFGFKCFLVLLVVFVIFMFTSYSDSFKDFINEKVFNNSFNFSKINQLYNKYFVNIENEETVPVVNETYYDFSSSTVYEDGISLNVPDNSAVKLLGSGVVVFIGEKEGFGNTLIMQQSNGVDVWYGNLKEINVTIYDYLTKDTIIASSNDKIYFKFMKDGETLSYKDI